MRKFEAHLTMDIVNSTLIQAKLWSDQLLWVGWKFSKIDGDALMGNKPYCYLTTYDADGNVLLSRCRHAEEILLRYEVPVLRIKVEEILFDTKTGVNNL